MPDDAPETASPPVDDTDSVPDTVHINTSLPNPTGTVSADRTLPGAARRGYFQRVAAGARADRAPDRSDRASELDARRRAELRADGGADRDGEYDRVRDAGIVVRLESDGVLLHAGAGRADGRWIATDRETLVTSEELR